MENTILTLVLHIGNDLNRAKCFFCNFRDGESWGDVAPSSPEPPEAVSGAEPKHEEGHFNKGDVPEGDLIESNYHEASQLFTCSMKLTLFQ